MPIEFSRCLIRFMRGAALRKNENVAPKGRKAQEKRKKTVNNDDSPLLLVVSVRFCGPIFSLGKPGRRRL
jgi:hypothetical protein